MMRRMRGEQRVTVSDPDPCTITVKLDSEFMTVEQVRSLIVELEVAADDAEAKNKAHGLPLDKPKRFWWR